MKAAPKFFICNHCGNVAEKLHDANVPLVCCGEPMQEMVANTTDAAQEKHVPAVTVEGNTISVQVGSVLHPMTPEHFIGFIWLETEQGSQCRRLDPSEAPTATFVVAPGDKAIAVYEWCNLHGLWKAEV